LAINNANIAVTGVVVDVKSAVTNAEVKVASLTTNPIATAASAKVYQYLQLTKSNIADTDASKITVNFKVPKSWLSTNNVAEGDVVLYRYSDSKWNALSTAVSGSDANNVLYSATTPGFSTFAIGSKEAAPAVTAPTEGAPAAAPAVPTEGATAAVPEEKPAEAAMEKKGLSTTAIAWIVVAVIVAVAGIGYFMWQKKKAE
jgi:PGF-pre-PGF domain-containing protein